MTAKDIQALLKCRHSSDIYVPECKNGSTWFANHLRLDGLAIARSWASPLITGYEVKVSRSDFLQDQKMNQYLQYCNALYIVCPSKLITPQEVPEQMGLIWVATTGTRLYTKKKAPYREIEEPAELYKYILISRARIYDVELHRGETDREYWENWLHTRDLDRQFGRRVGVAIREQVEQEIVKVRERADEMEREHRRYKDILAMLEEAGIDISVNGWALQDQVREKIRRIKGQLPPNFDRTLTAAIEYMEKLQKLLSGDQ